MDGNIAHLRISGWGDAWFYDVEAPWDRSVGEVIDAARSANELPLDTPYRAMQRDRQLHSLDTLRDAGVEEDVEIEVFAEVIAGAAR